MNVHLLCGVPVELTGTGWQTELLAGLPATSEPQVRRFALEEVETLPPAPASDGALLFRGPDFEARAEREGIELLLRDGELVVAHCHLSPDGPIDLRIRSRLTAEQRSLRDELLPELIVAHLWPFHGISYLHAAGVLSEARACLFLGPSGRGKSTAAKLFSLASGTPFCADRCGVSASPPWVAAAPWHGGSAGDGARAPLTALFFLSRIGPPRRRTLRAAEASTLLAANAFLPRWWPAGLEAGLDALVRLARTVPCFELCAEPDQRLVQRVQEVL